MSPKNFTASTPTTLGAALLALSGALFAVDVGGTYAPPFASTPYAAATCSGEYPEPLPFDETNWRVKSFVRMTMLADPTTGTPASTDGALIGAMNVSPCALRYVPNFVWNADSSCDCEPAT